MAPTSNSWAVRLLLSVVPIRDCLFGAWYLRSRCARQYLYASLPTIPAGPVRSSAIWVIQSGRDHVSGIGRHLVRRALLSGRCLLHMIEFSPEKASLSARRLRATLDHHGSSIHSGHYIASINCCKKSLMQRVWNYGKQKLLYCICYAIWIDWYICFGLEQESESLISSSPGAGTLLLYVYIRPITELI